MKRVSLLTRISHTRPAATADTPASAVFLAAAAPTTRHERALPWSKHHTDGRLHSLATKVRGICGRGSVLAAAIVVSLTPVTGCHNKGAPRADQAFTRQELQWRAQRLRRLTAPDGWLTLIGLDWLEPGPNSAGSAPRSVVLLPGAAPHAGDFILGPDQTVTFQAAPGAHITLAGRNVGRAQLRSDADGNPDILHAGRLEFYVIKRGARFAVRVKDPLSPTRTHFQGLSYFPIDPAYRVTATFTPFATPRKVEVPTMIGTTATMEAPGLVHFTLGGKPLTLTPLVETPGDTTFFFVFRDATSGKETYGGGRFLDTPAPKGSTLVLDFNRAYNPPCAFTHFATCPLPPEGNDLPVPVYAGEKAPHTTHG
ncbi:MAG: DUF1684 domain-containing protein [Acidobacteria bacterium]|nr:DUF1684 domain-containing protein [Acidobacteriota bacterium]